MNILTFYVHLLALSSLQDWSAGVLGDLFRALEMWRCWIQCHLLASSQRVNEKGLEV